MVSPLTTSLSHSQSPSLSIHLEETKKKIAIYSCCWIPLQALLLGRPRHGAIEGSVHLDRAPGAVEGGREDAVGSHYVGAVSEVHR